MGISVTFNRNLYKKQKRGLPWLAGFNRIARGTSSLPPGLVKIIGKRFIGLSIYHLMGHIEGVFYRTCFFKTISGVIKVTTVCLLLIRITANFYAVMLFPALLNLCILLFAVHFEGTNMASPLVVLAILYLLWWAYAKLKFLLPFYDQMIPAVRTNFAPWKRGRVRGRRVRAWGGWMA